MAQEGDDIRNLVVNLHNDVTLLWLTHNIKFLLTITDTIESYDPTLDTWMVVRDMPSSHSWLSSVALTIRKDLGKEKGLEIEANLHVTFIRRIELHTLLLYIFSLES